MLWEAALVEPVDPSHRGELDIVDGLERAVQERASLRYCLGLEQPNCALGQRIVVRIPTQRIDAAIPSQRCHPRRQARVPHISGAMEADLAARRPKVAKLVEHEPLREYVQEVLSGVIRDENGEV